jgi:hypothetical protein
MPTHVACARVAHARVVVSCAQRQRRRRQGWRRHGQAHARHSRIGGEGVVLVSVVPVQHHCDVPSCGVLSCAVQKTEPKSESGAGSGIKLGRFNKDPRDGGGGALLLHVVRHCRCLYARRSSRGVAWRGVAWRYCGLRRAALCALRCPAFSDVDLEKLRDAIQKVCRSTDPLGRSMVRGTAARCCGGDM